MENIGGSPTDPAALLCPELIGSVATHGKKLSYAHTHRGSVFSDLGN